MRVVRAARNITGPLRHDTVQVERRAASTPSPPRRAKPLAADARYIPPRPVAAARAQPSHAGRRVEHLLCRVFPLRAPAAASCRSAVPEVRRLDSCVLHAAFAPYFNSDFLFLLLRACFVRRTPCPTCFFCRRAAAAPVCWARRRWVGTGCAAPSQSWGDVARPATAPDRAPPMILYNFRSRR